MRNDDRQLLRRLAWGERDCFWVLWERYRSCLYRRCLSWFGGHPQKAEDALSEAMIKVWERLPDCAGEIENLSGWLNRFTIFALSAMPPGGHRAARR